MKQKIKQSLMAIVALLLSSTIFAHDFDVDGIYYDYIDETAKTVEVTCKGDYSVSYSNEYTGSVSIPSTVTFYGTTYSVTSIGSYAFEECSGLTSVIIPNSVTEIGKSAFEDCTGLTSITIPNSVTEIGKFAFKNCVGLTSVNFNAENCILPKDARNGIFKGCTSLRTANIGNSVKLIPANIFFDCKVLTSITISNSVTEIGHQAFLGCTGLTSINIPNSVTSIGRAAFWNCTGLTSITIPNSVTEIGSSAFEYCTGLTKLSIENGTDSLALDQDFFEDSPIEILHLGRNISYSTKKSPFYNKSTLSSVTIGNTIKSIDKYTFEKCTGLKNLAIEKGEETLSLGTTEFYDCPLETLYLGRNISRYTDPLGFGFSPFDSKEKLKEVSIGNSVTAIENKMFDNCFALSKVIIEDGTETLSLGANGVENAEGLFYDCPLDSLYLGRNIIYPGGGLSGISPFYKKTTLKNIIIGNFVTEIGDFAFNDCSGLNSLSIGSSVKEIGRGAFSGCTLSLITSYCMTPPSCDGNSFDGYSYEGNSLNVGINYSALLLVPEGTKEIYKNAHEWEKFYNIKEIAGIEDVMIDNVAVKITVESGNITINSIENPQVELYNINGQCVYCGNETSIPVSTNGIYILKINGKSYKIAI